MDGVHLFSSPVKEGFFLLTVLFLALRGQTPRNEGRRSMRNVLAANAGCMALAVSGPFNFFYGCVSLKQSRLLHGMRRDKSLILVAGQCTRDTMIADKGAATDNTPDHWLRLAWWHERPGSLAQRKVWGFERQSGNAAASDATARHLPEIINSYA